MKIATSLEDFADIRMIALEALPLHLRQTQNRKEMAGMFLGLVHPSKVERGVLPKTKIAPSGPTKTTARRKHVARSHRPVVTPTAQRKREEHPLPQKSVCKRSLATAFEESYIQRSPRTLPRKCENLAQLKQPPMRRSPRLVSARQHLKNTDEH